MHNIYKAVRTTSRDAIMYAVMIGIFGALIVDAVVQNYTVIEYAQAQEPKIILIRSEVDWTKERIKEEIATVFPENAEQMIKVAECESKFDRYAEGTTDDWGIFQLHAPSHDLSDVDVFDPRENIAFARKLYDESGLRPWNSSRHCWK